MINCIRHRERSVYEIKFDKNNRNAIIIKRDGRILHIIACPPVDNGCDVIAFGNKLNDGYTYNFDGLILITHEGTRMLYHRGRLIDVVPYAEARDFFR